MPDTGRFLASLKDGLRDLGWVEGTDFSLQVREADGAVATFRRLGGELVASPGRCIGDRFDGRSDRTRANHDKPADCVRRHIRPRGGGPRRQLGPSRPESPTGVAGFQADIAAKWVAQLKEIAPDLTAMVILSNPASVSSAGLAGWKAVAAKSVSIGEAHVDAVADVDPAVADVARKSARGRDCRPSYVSPGEPQSCGGGDGEASRARHVRRRRDGESGWLGQLRADLAAQWHMSAAYIDKIARGARAAHLPVQQATEYALTINLAAAKALGLKIPQKPCSSAPMRSSSKGYS